MTLWKLYTERLFTELISPQDFIITERLFLNCKATIKPLSLSLCLLLKFNWTNLI